MAKTAPKYAGPCEPSTVEEAHRQAIVTRYMGPTNFRGSRVKATCAAGSLTLSWDDSLDTAANHAAACKALADRLGWGGKWRGGGMPDGRGDVFVCCA